MDKSEILVHISAPSGAVDDAHYRAQVDAILNFQTHSRETIPLRPGETDSYPSSSHPGTSPFTGAADIINSPPRVSPLPSHLVPTQLGAQKDSLETPLSVIPDSQPQPGVDTECLTIYPEPEPETPQCSSHLPSKRRRVDSPPPALDHLQHDEMQAGSVGGNRNTTTAHTSPIVTPNTVNEGKNPRSTNTIAQLKCPTIPLSLPLEIKPPPPPISTSPFTTHITPTLEMLSTRLKSPRTYSPAEQTRDLDSLERGHWYLRLNLIPSGQDNTHTPAINTSAPTPWDMVLFSRFWTFLSDFIKEGRAGWGVWCILEAEGDEGSNSTSPSKEAEEHSHSTDSVKAQHLVSLKIFTWGEIARHIYLLLFLASERQIRKMGAQWRDAGDKVVIQMP